VFRTNFLKEQNYIPKLSGSVYEFIYQGYYGGHVDALYKKSYNSLLIIAILVFS
jgi:hypothetical protein